MGLLDNLAGSLGTSGIADAIARHTGADPKTVQNAVAIGMPLLLAALARNASSPKGAADLHAAVATDHAGGNILSNVQSAVQNPNLADGQGILGHVLGDKQAAVQSQIAQATGMSSDKVGTVLATVAPLVMGALGQAQQKGGLNAGGLAGLLGNEAASVTQQHPELGNLAGVLEGQAGAGATSGLMQMGEQMLGKLFGKS
ncbi:MAG TPA: DUF937 domain-containing protein [Gemmatimonadaceae bacterium]|jgi:hypothetical protein